MTTHDRVHTKIRQPKTTWVLLVFAISVALAGALGLLLNVPLPL